MYNDIYIIYRERERLINFIHTQSYTRRYLRIYRRPDQDMSQASGWMKERLGEVQVRRTRPRHARGSRALGSTWESHGKTRGRWGISGEIVWENMGKCWMLMMFEQFLNNKEKCIKPQNNLWGDNNLTSYFPHSEHPFVVYPTLTHNHMMVLFGDPIGTFGMHFSPSLNLLQASTNG